MTPNELTRRLVNTLPIGRPGLIGPAPVMLECQPCPSRRYRFTNNYANPIVMVIT